MAFNSMTAFHSYVEEAIRPASLAVAKALHLPYFPPHAPTFAIAFIGFALVQWVFAPLLSSIFFPSIYLKLPKKTRYNWNVHVLSMSHVVIALPWAYKLATTSMPAVENDRVFGWDDRLGELHAFSCAYFLYDTIESLLGGAEFGFVIHGASCLFIYGNGYRPWVAYFGPRALLWELSTPFLNIHWFLDKAGKTGSTFQLINGMLLLSTFAGARLVFGSYTTWQFWKALYSARGKASDYLIGGMILGNLALNTLNWIWFSKMIAALQKRFKAPPQADARPKILTPTITVEGSELKVPNGKDMKRLVPKAKSPKKN